MPSTTYDPRTLSVHAGLVPDAITGAIAPNICTTSNFVFNPGMTFSANLNPDMTSLPYVYSRWTNPTVRQLELRLAALEGADDGVCTASGMAAITTLFFGVLKSGDHIIVSDVCYPGVRELLTDIMSDYGVTNTAVNLSVIEEVQAALRPNTRLIHAESPCNPLLRLTDIAALAVVAKTANALFSVDSTVATPVATNPIALGADFVIHSLTKFINGHGDALGGVLLGRKEAIEPIRSKTAVHFGACLAAQSAWLIMRGVDSLFARMDYIGKNALQVAHAVESHPAVIRVLYPGLPSHPQHDLACRQMKNFSGMMTFQTKADPKTVALALAAPAADGGCKLIHFAVSLGHQRTNVVLMDTKELMDSTYHLEGAALHDYRTYAGDAVFRMSVGMEAPEDVLTDLFSVLDRFV